jgi:hypothetical protein
MVVERPATPEFVGVSMSPPIVTETLKDFDPLPQFIELDSPEVDPSLRIQK